MVLDKIVGAASASPGDYRLVLEGICTELGEFFVSTLGNGMSKLIEDPHGNFVIAGDGATLVRELHLRYRHPIVACLLEAGDEQGRLCGDLVKATVALACRLVLAGLGLMGQGIHANHVRGGFSCALQAMLKQIKPAVQRVPINLETIDAHIAGFLAQRLSPDVSRHLARLVAGPLARHLAKLEPQTADRARVRSAFIDTLGLVINTGGNIADSFAVQGPGIVKDPLHWQTTWDLQAIGQLENFKIAMVSGELYFDKKKRGDSISVVLQASDQPTFKDGIDAIWARKARMLASKGVQVLITERGIDDALVSALNGLDPPVLVFRRAKLAEMELVARHVGAFITHDLDTLEDVDLGHARSIEVLAARGDTCFVFQNERDPDHRTLVIRGSMYDVCDAVKHHVVGAIGHCIDAAIGGTISGFPWIFDDFVQAARQHENVEIPPREMLAREAFFHEVEWLPRIMQANQGIDPLAPRQPGVPDHPVTAVSVEHMLETATMAAVQLLRVDALLINPAGWQKRTGQKHEEKENYMAEN
jgi:chaperonin GroEL (HSP60 family)